MTTKADYRILKTTMPARRWHLAWYATKVERYIAAAIARTFASCFSLTRPALGTACAMASEWETTLKKAERVNVDARLVAWAERTEKPEERVAVAVVMVFFLNVH